MSAPQTLLVPSFTRKKNVRAKFNPNTYRVVIGDAERWGVREPLPLLAVPDHLTKRHSVPETNHAPRLASDLRHNNPQPWHCSFLRTNVRTLNNPVCHVATHCVREEQPEWWRTDIINSKKPAPPQTDDSTFRGDYKPWKNIRGSTRHSNNPNTLAAAGIVPVTSMHERNGHIPIWQDELSYEHMYDSRTKNNYPPRAKRHGAFVWRETGHHRSEDLKAEHKEIYEGESEAPSINWPPPGLTSFHRQFQRRPRVGEDTVASLMQPEFAFSWNEPNPMPKFTE